MEIVCLDLEGVLVPEIWIAFAEETGIPELKRTTRDEPDYDKLMKYRLGILKGARTRLKGNPGHHRKDRARWTGAREFLDSTAGNGTGYHHQRYLLPVCGASYEEAGLSYHLLQLPCGRRQRRNHRFQDAHVRNPNTPP